MYQRRDKENLLRFMYELLPATYRLRDKRWHTNEPSHSSQIINDPTLLVNAPGPLGEFLSILAEQAMLLDENVHSLYDNWFIETCQEWVVPYIGDLIGYQLAQTSVPQTDNDLGTQHRPALFSVRREVANTIRYRRRKGSVALLETLAGDIAGWHARAVEFYPLLVVSPPIRHSNAYEGSFTRGGLVNLRDTKILDLLDSANGSCNEIAHTIDVRRIGSGSTSGRFNMSNIAIFACRLKTFSITRAPARSQEDRGVPHCYTFSALGNDFPLFTEPQEESSAAQLAGPLNLPIPIRRRALSTHNADSKAAVPPWIASNEYYGSEKSFCIRVAGWKGKEIAIEAGGVIPTDRIIPADLTGWQYQPPSGYVAVDPELGRITFHQQERPRDVWVSYHYAFPAEVGGGEYKRRLVSCRAIEPSKQAADSSLKCYSVSAHLPSSNSQDAVFNTLHGAFEKWAEERPMKAVIEIQDSAVYDEVDARTIRLHQDQELQFRAKDGCRPIVRFVDRFTGRAESLLIEGDKNSRLELNGLLIAGRGLEVKKCLKELAIIDSTLVPGWDLEQEHDQKSPGGEILKARVGKPSLSLEATGLNVKIASSILGPIQVNNGSALQKTTLRISNSVLDACGSEEPVICGPGAQKYAVLLLQNATILGRIYAHCIESADNTIFTEHVHTERRQSGCMRFCYVPPNSHTPRRYHCQPDLAIASVEGAYKIHEAARVRPIFTSTHYGSSTYCQLHEKCAVEITMGAEDQSEMGVYHNLFAAQRGRALQLRLNEYVPGGFESRVVFIN